MTLDKSDITGFIPKSQRSNADEWSRIIDLRVIFELVGQTMNFCVCVVGNESLSI